MAELGLALDAHADQITKSHSELIEGSAGLFGSGPRSADSTSPVPDLNALQLDIGTLTLENDILDGILIWPAC